MFKESIVMSWQNIITNKMRSFLTILGIIIGVAAIIALITIVQSATGSITEIFSSMGANKITVTVRGTPLKDGLTEADLRDLYAIDNVEGIAPAITSTGSIAYGGNARNNVNVKGLNELYFIKSDGIIARGRAINRLDVENQTKVCLIGRNIVGELFPLENPVGKTVRVNGVNYVVIGTLTNSLTFITANNNNSVIIPYTTAMRFTGNKHISSLDVYMKDDSVADETTKEIERTLTAAFNDKDNAVRIFNMQDMLENIDQVTAMMSILLAGIASIALIVGGIGIMNMMLVSVTERTVEIGLRKALGAEPRRIRQQFLIEAVFLSMIGGILGLIAGVGISMAVCAVMDATFKISTATIILAVGFSSVIGIIFGYSPANKASRLNPIDALRSV